MINCFKLNKNKAFIYFFVLLFIGCGRKRHAGEIDFRAIDLRTKSIGLLSDYFSDVEYILLEPSEQFPLVNPMKLSMRDGYIYVLDRFQNFIFIYSQTGQIYSLINRIGHGPDEYLGIDDFQVMDSSIWIKDGLSGKLMEFDKSGELLSSRKNNFLLGDFFLGNDFELYYLNNDPEFDGRIIKKNSDKITSYIPIENWMVKRLVSTFNGFIENTHNNSIFYVLPMGYQVAEFDLSGELIRNFEFDFGEFSFLPEQRAKFPTQEEESNYLEGTAYIRGIFNLLPYNNGYLLYLRQESNQRHFVFLDKNMNQKSHYTSFKNDIDGLELNKPIWTFGPNEIYFLYYPGQFLDAYSSTFGQPDSMNFSPETAVHKFVKENFDKLYDEGFVLVKLTALAGK